MRSASPLGRQSRLRRTVRSPSSASSTLSSTVWFSNTVGFWNLRPMPSWAMAASSWAVRSTLPLSNSTSPASGLVLPVMTSIMVVLPAPFGPMMARISPARVSSDRLLIARKPSKLTVTPFEVEQALRDVAGLVDDVVGGRGSSAAARRSLRGLGWRGAGGPSAPFGCTS